MALSVFDLFSIGIGPSSSHTVGPMRAAVEFLELLGDKIPAVSRVRCTLNGSLGATGVGHGTDRAVMLGLMGEIPEIVNPKSVAPAVADVQVTGRLKLGGTHDIAFSPNTDIVLDGLHELPGHPNGMRLEAWDEEGNYLADQIYYSVGGGFIVSGDISPADPVVCETTDVPFPYETASDLLAHCAREGKSIAEIAYADELSMHTAEEIDRDLHAVWDVMQECVRNGATSEGRLPGGLQVLRRAPALYRKLTNETTTDPLSTLDWVSFYALAVNEENAAGGRVVTAPTNGAAGIIPAVLHYYRDFIDGADWQGVKTFLLTSAAIGMIFKNTASISGAEVGCQGEVGSACSMAAAGCAAVMGGTPAQVENAAEIAMEHNLGLTCDPIGGLVQVPCIERNAIAAVKAITAARTAIHGDGSHVVSLDDVIVTMRETGRDMQAKYKETALGGLAVHVGVSVNVVEC
ncbi:L-serine ammonia-lyase [Arcanobacterium pinnipediorum]|uniref:L-serine dehydratase n=1 Tax=Arcanobacterium pinnipediorum TaxID=1503041 RepID=A0ABY5AJ75_9ACTO|nr:L-serine ammonia-lyase [Arcanobacterium pinnipediorum]USR80152.1 L-serine ammonia-lyase [Arcanobacterium pinnipediorum]